MTIIENEIMEPDLSHGHDLLLSPHFIGSFMIHVLG